MQTLRVNNKYLYCLTIVFVFLSGCMVHSQKTDQQLRSAVLTSDLKSVEHFILQGADVNSKDENRGWTPLLYATEAGDEKIATLLLRHGANPNLVSTENKISALHRAAANGHLKIAKILIENGADIDYQDAKLRSTPLMWAVVKNHKIMVQLLLENKALINARGHRGESALCLAVSNQNVDVVKLLLAHNAIKDRPDIYGATPLQKAIRINNKTIINLLKEK